MDKVKQICSIGLGKIKEKGLSKLMACNMELANMFIRLKS